MIAQQKTLNIFQLIFFSVILCSCASSKQNTSAEDLQKLDNLVESKFFEIILDQASPSSTSSMNFMAQSGLLPYGSSVSRINLIGHSNYLRFEGDSISADLPYYGERQIGGGYNSDQSIVFDDKPKDLVIEKNEEKNFYNIEFSINKDTESYKVNLKIYPNLKADIFVNSSHRLGINYGGRVEEIEEETE